MRKNAEGDEVEALILNGAEEYTAFIMRVINSAIQVAQDNKEDPRERTTFEIFTDFSRNLFWLAQQKQYQEILTDI
jgi:hypothetical protein